MKWMLQFIIIPIVIGVAISVIAAIIVQWINKISFSESWAKVCKWMKEAKEWAIKKWYITAPLLFVIAILTLASFTRRYDESFLSSLLRMWDWIINFAIEFPLPLLFFLYLIDSVVKFQKKKKAAEEYAATISGLSDRIEAFESELDGKINEKINAATEHLNNERHEDVALLYEEMGDSVFIDGKYEEAIYFYVSGIERLNLVVKQAISRKMNFVRKINDTISKKPSISDKTRDFCLRILEPLKDTLNEPITSVVDFIKTK